MFKVSIMNFKAVFVALIAILSWNEILARTCDNKDENPYLMFSTKTSYFKVFNGSNIHDENGCQAKSLWMLARHGSRYPGSDDILVMADRGVEIKDAIVEAYSSGKGSLCHEDFIQFQSWSFNWTQDDGSLLSESGKLEMFQIGQRVRKRFFDDIKDETHIHFRRTYKKRTGQSAESFAEGAFPDQSVEILKPLHTDPLLRFFDFCTKWINDIDENPETYKEQRLFGETDVMKKTLKDIGLAIGFNEELNLTDGLIIYDICRYEQAHQPDKFSVWCSVFQETHLKVFEYYEELKYWHKNGYGHALNYLMACPLVQDAALTLQKEEIGKSGTFYFSHSEAILPFLAALDLFKDKEPLRHDNFHTMSERHYQTSRIGSFSSNVIFVLLECEEFPQKRLLTYHQERRIKLPRCDSDPCNWDQFMSRYQDVIGCQFDQLCGTDDQANEEFINLDSNSGETNNAKSLFSLKLCMLCTFLFGSALINS
ncbi:multiple inositol polyphosphate phosphatase 1-like isoform X2 [Tigriopus californicus]|uniref:multiple inositol polyphosphate phosphatase 1-like isoform X2 n=1 Tax=Tigriopus californicus TaxID=6832 RepID=UPI0027D9D226|nr:multiple inositol polyphosphate phosphatase 1-like isoform X2 [Tigriopus californicus]